MKLQIDKEVKQMADFTKMTKYIDNLSGELDIPGADVAVYRNNECIYRHAEGYSDAAKTKPMNGKEQFFLYSASKVITMTAMMILIEEGKVSLDDEAGKFYPAFYDVCVKTPEGLKKAKNKITVKSLMTMTAGFSYDLNSEPIMEVKAKKVHENPMEEIMNAIARMPLLFEPSTHFQYSLCHDVVGGIIEKASGMKFGEFLKKRIFEPVGMTHTRFALDESDNPDFMEQYVYDDEKKENIPSERKVEYTLIPGYESGGAGLLSCVDDYAKFAAMLAAGGVTKDGVRVLSRESIDKMRTPMLDEKIVHEGAKYYQGYSYGLGVRTMIDKEKCGAKSPIGEFGWDGAAGAYMFVDVENNLSLFYAQQIRNCARCYDIIHPALRDLTYECLGI